MTVIANSFWEEHYARFGELRPSPFCEYAIREVLRDGDAVLELGCGNGRDALAFASHGYRYHGIDLSPKAIEAARAACAQRTDLLYQPEFMSADATVAPFPTSTGGRTIAYCRFFLHTLSASQETDLLSRLSRRDAAVDLILIETRTVFDELYDQGTAVGPDAFITDHYRRFIDPTAFVRQAASMFKIDNLLISRGLAPYGAEDPIVLRTVLRPHHVVEK